MSGSRASSGRSSGQTRLDPVLESRALDRLADIAVAREQTADDPAAGPTVGSATVEALTALTARFSAPPAAVQAEVERWTAEIHRRVGDPNLGKFADGRACASGAARVQRIAWALAEGELKRRHLDRDLNAMDAYARKHQVGSRAGLFMRIIGRTFRELGLSWDLGEFDRSGQAKAAADVAGTDEVPLP